MSSIIFRTYRNSNDESAEIRMDKESRLFHLLMCYKGKTYIDRSYIHMNSALKAIKKYSSAEMRRV